MDDEAKTWGRWRGRDAFLWYGDVFVPLPGGGWIRQLPEARQNFRPYEPEDYNDPGLLLKLQRLAGLR